VPRFWEELLKRRRDDFRAVGLPNGSEEVNLLKSKLFALQQRTGACYWVCCEQYRKGTKRPMTIEITPKTTVSDLLEAYPEAAPLFISRKMACVGCSMSRFETLSDATQIYRVDLNSLMDEIFRLVFRS
jgi:hybrid cluster-associated redox disulfide protein